MDYCILLTDFYRGEGMNRIKALRSAAGLSQAQLGSAIGCVGQTISKLETESRQLDPTVIHALCDYFKVTSDYLLGRSETPLPVLSDEDARLLEAFHSAPPETQAAIRLLILPQAPEKRAVS